MIEQAFHAYTKAVEAKFEVSQRPPLKKRGLEVLPNKARHLCDLVEQLEGGPEFRSLLEATRLAFRRDDWHSAKASSSWTDPVRIFFRRTGFYTDTFFKDPGRPCDLAKRYEEAFQRRHVETIYLAPMEFVKFAKEEMKFPGFEIRKFDRDELDAIVGNDVNRVFFPNAVLNERALDVLQDYWFIVARAPAEVRPLGLLTISKEDMGWVSQKYTDFPPAIERALERLVLFNWVGNPKDPSTYSGQDGYRFGFNVPFVLRVDDNDLTMPRSVPVRPTLESYTTIGGDPYTGEEYEGHFGVFNLNESRVATFEQCIKRADECLGHLRLETDNTRWPFLKVAIGNLIKAFFTDGLEQLLWHITALDALLGEKHSTREPMARRSAALLGTTKGQKEEIREQFEKLYRLRCDLVHGNQFKKDIHRKQLFEARMIVLQVMIQFVHYLGKIAAEIEKGAWKGDIPDREDFLILLDRRIGNAEQNRLQGILKHLPKAFPSAPDWSP